jgi:hypothetical protein
LQPTQRQKRRVGRDIFVGGFKKNVKSIDEFIKANVRIIELKMGAILKISILVSRFSVQKVLYSEFGVEAVR